MGPVGVPFEQGQDLRAGFRVDMSTPVFIVGSQANRVAALVAEGVSPLNSPCRARSRIPFLVWPERLSEKYWAKAATMVMNNLPSGVE